MALLIELRKDECINVEGPAIMEIVRGEGEIFGAPVREGDKISVPPAKAIPYYAHSTSKIRIEGGKIVSILGYYVPRQWDLAVGEIASRKKPLKVMIIGDIDSGKSTLTAYLANRLYSMGFNVAIVDSDVGQSSIGPPTTIGLGIMKGHIITLEDVPLVNAFFLGNNTPAGLFHRMITGVFLMVQEALSYGTDIVLIDTTGWIRDAQGRNLKMHKIRVVDPDIVIVLEGAHGELSHIVRAASLLTDVILMPKGMARPRSRGERKKLREISYRKYLMGSRNVEISLNDVKVIDGPLLTGIMHVLKQNNREYYYEINGNIIRVYASNTRLSKEVYSEIIRRQSPYSDLKVISKRDIRNLLIAMYDKRMKFLGIGIIQDVDFNKRILKVYTSVDKDKIKYVEIGWIKVNPTSFNEVGRYSL
ncbi:MAG: hypothetical protein DRZ82_00130 [Thermoprotei archaeon]|nr:MAG: hypothetical protein DRZ82_00130 [Thermoprotei archaeon]